MRGRMLYLWAAGAILASACSASAQASNADFGYVTTVYGTLSGAVLFSTTGARTSPPVCQGSSVPQRFALDTSTTAGQQQATILRDANAKRKRIYIVGTGNCSIWGDSETVNFFQVEDNRSLSSAPIASGHITGTFNSGGGNMAFRVTLDTGLSSNCAGGFAYVNKAFDNYQVYVANLMSAYYSGRSVSLTYGVDSAGYCQIIEYGTS